MPDKIKQKQKQSIKQSVDVSSESKNDSTKPIPKNKSSQPKKNITPKKEKKPKTSEKSTQKPRQKQKQKQAVKQHVNVSVQSSGGSGGSGSGGFSSPPTHYPTPYPYPMPPQFISAPRLGENIPHRNIIEQATKTEQKTQHTQTISEPAITEFTPTVESESQTAIEEEAFSSPLNPFPDTSNLSLLERLPIASEYIPAEGEIPIYTMRPRGGESNVMGPFEPNLQPNPNIPVNQGRYGTSETGHYRKHLLAEDRARFEADGTLHLYQQQRRRNPTQPTTTHPPNPIPVVHESTPTQERVRIIPRQTSESLPLPQSENVIQFVGEK